VLGRTVKTEVLNWQGGAPYSTTINTFNARDQVTLVRQFDAAQGTVPSDPNDLSCPDGSCQKTMIGYDGYGRLKTKHVPEQDADTATSWDYNIDDTIQRVTDARGASQNFTYNARHLVTGITPTPSVSFTYDAASNHTSMTDGSGSTSYQYNQLSQLNSETRTFDGLSGSYPISYDYNLAGELKKITDPANVTINYGFNSVGRLTSVFGSDTLYSGVSNYASGFQYRAWGALKSISYGNSYTMAASFNARMLPTQFEVAGRPPQYGPPTVMKTQ
jgi:YD repeat-containing protein